MPPSEALALALQHHRAGRLDAAEQIYRQILAADPNHPEALHLLGVIARQLGQHAIAVEYIRRAIAVKGNAAEFHHNLANVYREMGRLDEAAASYRRALELNPNLVDAHNNLGVVLRDQGKLAAAIACFRRAVALAPSFLDAHNNLGVALKDQGKPDEAVASYRQALALNPNLAEVECNLSLVLAEQGKLDEAIVAGRHSVALNPNLTDAWNNLGLALKDQGKLDEAIACCRRALALDPDFIQAHSNLIFTEIFRDGRDPHAQLSALRGWNDRHAAPFAQLIQPHPNDRSPNRRLRLGYLSPDFRDHCQAFFTTPLFSSHNRTDFEIFAYSDVVRSDPVTERLRSQVDAWRPIAGLTDDQVAHQIRRDRIDILVDLTMHMARHRLLVFARKPAPIQVTWLAYPGSTGLTAIDYRLTDPYLDPPGLHDDHYSETSIRLPKTFWCYDPLTQEPSVNKLPALRNGYLTFGCLNNFCKVNPIVLKLWARVLRCLDRSRLIMMAGEGSHRQETLNLLAADGISRDRVTFVPHQPRPRYLLEYHNIDLGLDTIPYNGHTTTLDSIWMGVPVITLVGPTVVGRAGLSQLTNLGLPDLIAHNPDEYVQIAAELAQDLPRLSDLRATLRERMQSSPLMNAAHFARSIEAAYHEMWRRWCS